VTAPESSSSGGSGTGAAGAFGADQGQGQDQGQTHSLGLGQSQTHSQGLRAFGENQTHSQGLNQIQALIQGQGLVSSEPRQLPAAASAAPASAALPARHEEPEDTEGDLLALLLS
jgi:hypothetical protein